MTRTFISLSQVTRMLGLCALSIGLSGPAFAADHLDGPAVSSDPTADITDFLAWMSPDASKLTMALNVVPFASEGSTFSDAVAYVFNVGSANAYGETTTDTQLICSFYGAGEVECWLGDQYIAGDASNEVGISNESGSLRVFAGMRNDPFFFEFGGFGQAVAATTEAAPSLEFDGFGCPALDEETAGGLVSLLQSSSDGSPASNTFAGANVLALVVEIDKNLVNQGGPILAAWGSTHQIAD